MRLAREAVTDSGAGVYSAASAGILGTLLLEESAAASVLPDPGRVDLAIELLTRARDDMPPAIRSVSQRKPSSARAWDFAACYGAT